jgi:hypothetical protein
MECRGCGAGSGPPDSRRGQSTHGAVRASTTRDRKLERGVLLTCLEG